MYTANVQMARTIGVVFRLSVLFTLFRIGYGKIKRRSLLQLLLSSGICLSQRISGPVRGKRQISILCQKLTFQWREGTFGGINVTLVIARALEKAVGKIYAQRPVEEQILESQFA